MMKKSDNDIMKSSDPMQTTTTQKYDFIPHTVQKISFHQPDTYKKPEGEIETVSSYAKEFNYKTQERVQPIRRVNPRKELPEFEGFTTNKSDYRQWTPVAKTDGFRPQKKYEHPTEVFEGESTYEKDFNSSKMRVQRDLIKPVTSTKLSTDPFIDITSNRQDYTRHQLPVKVSKPVKEYTPNKIPLDDMTTMKQSYTAKDSTKLKSFKPDNTALPDTPFDFSTTTKNDYKQWDCRPMLVKKDNEYVPPLGEMDMNTNYSKDFAGHAAPPAKAIRPPVNKKLDVKFEGSTTYELDFQKKENTRRDLIKKNSEYQKSDQPFEGESTYKGQFIANKGEAAKSFKPNLVHNRPQEKFDSETSYRREYNKNV